LTLLLREATVALDIHGKLPGVYAVGATVAFVSYLILIPAYSGAGAAWSLLIAEVFVLLGISFLIFRTGRVRFDAQLTLGGLFSGAIAAAILLALQHTEVNFLVRTAVVGATYIAALVLTRTIPLKMFLQTITQLRLWRSTDD
jgi:hypothetical protein